MLTSDPIDVEEDDTAAIIHGGDEEDDDGEDDNNAIIAEPATALKSSQLEGDEERLIPLPPPLPPNNPELHGKLKRRQKTAMTLRVVRKWLQKIIYAQAIGNIIRALPIFIVEKYMLMLLIFFQLIFLACGHFGTKMLRPYLILIYSLGIVATTFPDLALALTYVRHSIYLPHGEAAAAFALYLTLVIVLSVLNLVGGLLLGIRMCTSVMVLKNPQEYALVLQAASWIGSFDAKDDASESKEKKSPRRTLQWSGSVTDSLPATPPVKFVSNEVHTSKYNVFTFLPMLIYIQFSRLANLYTLCIVTLCMFSFSPVGPLSSLTPLLVVFGVAGAKELVEDIKRHRQDKQINTRGTLVFRQEQGDFVPTTWAEVKVGDVLMINNGEMIPCDLLVLSSSRQDGRCYLETANLDGETNLKHRVQLPQFASVQAPKDLTNIFLSLECEGPNSSIYTFEGALTLKMPGLASAASPATSPSSSPTSSKSPQSWKRSSGMKKPGNNVYSIGGDMILQRGTTLRNTPWVYGLAVYTGKETKVEQNGVPAPLKRSFLEKSVNVKLIVLLLLQTIVCIVCSIGHNQWKVNLARPEEIFPWYISIGPGERDFMYHHHTF